MIWPNVHDQNVPFQRSMCMILSCWWFQFYVMEHHFIEHWMNNILNTSHHFSNFGFTTIVSDMRSFWSMPFWNWKYWYKAVMGGEISRPEFPAEMRREMLSRPVLSRNWNHCKSCLVSNYIFPSLKCLDLSWVKFSILVCLEFCLVLSQEFLVLSQQNAVSTHLGLSSISHLVSNVFLSFLRVSSRLGKNLSWPTPDIKKLISTQAKWF